MGLEDFKRERKNRGQDRSGQSFIITIIKYKIEIRMLEFKNIYQVYKAYINILYKPE